MELYIELSMARKSEKDKRGAFLYMIGQKGHDVYNAMNLDDLQCDKTDVLFTKFEEYCKPKHNCRKISIQHLSARQGRTNRSICHWYDLLRKTVILKILKMNSSGTE